MLTPEWLWRPAACGSDRPAKSESGEPDGWLRSFQEPLKHVALRAIHSNRRGAAVRLSLAHRKTEFRFTSKFSPFDILRCNDYYLVRDQPE